MSREVDLYKDKIEVSLDGRQIFYLFFGGAVIVGLVFVLGVMVGRRVEARGHVDRANVTTTADPLAALDRLEGGNRLSFQDALRGTETAPSDVEKKIESMQKAPAAPVKSEKKAEPKKEEPKKDEPKKDEPKKVEAKAEAKVEEKKVEEKKVEEKKTEAKVEEKKVEEKKQKFTLQLSSFQDKNEAQAYLDSVKGSGYQAYVTEGEVEGKQFFRVRMGSYKSLEAANEAKSEFEKSAKKTAIVTKL
ncbi:MAG TPA: SPOR domain-containing protein [Kofleriaceae bacterium]|nr:SPOR domain-containing protein [Kofleriaceae bacterium]